MNLRKFIFFENIELDVLKTPVKTYMGTMPLNQLMDLGLGHSVHHLKQLADGGSDTTTNAIAVCPNCHRELHFGVNKVNIKMKVYDSIDRLISE